MIVLVVLAAAAAGLYFAFRPAATPTAAGPSTVMRDVTASTTTLTTSVGASGTMQPAQQSNLSFSSAGTVTAVTVAVGDKVSAGAVLAAIDLADLQSNVDAAQAAVDAATDDVTTAEASGTTAAINAANSTLKIKQNALTQAQTALAGGTLTAPFDGTVAAVNVKVGDSVGGSGGGGGGGSTTSSTAITVITADRYVVSVGVSSADIGKIKKGLTAEVTPSGVTRPLPGTVTGVGVIASTSQGSNTASFPVTVTLDEAQTGLYAGISATVSIVLSSRPNVLVVPAQAVTVAADGSATVEKKQADGTYVTTPVKTGQASGSSVEIISGLAAGDTVAVVVVVPAAGATPSRGGSNGYGNNNGGFPGFPDTGGGPGVIVGGGSAPGVQVTNYQGGPGGTQRTP